MGYRGKKQNHRTIGAHVSEALWQTVQYQALVEKVSASMVVKQALVEYLEKRGAAIQTYAMIVAQDSFTFGEASASNNS